jgi:hypothetical protein
MSVDPARSGLPARLRVGVSAAALLAALTVFLPWVELPAVEALPAPARAALGTAPVMGMQHGGPLFLVALGACAVGAAVAVWRTRPLELGWICIVASSIALLLAVRKQMDFMRSAELLRPAGITLRVAPAFLTLLALSALAFVAATCAQVLASRSDEDKR